MEQINRLGIYWSRHSATGVVLANRGTHPGVVACLTVRISEDQPAESVAQALTEAIRRKGLTYTDSFVAVDAANYTQHNLHTAFTEFKQIAHTIKFDIEESIATDATNLSIAFAIAGVEADGSSVAVFTGDRTAMIEMLGQMQRAGLDPETVEPDIICLARFFQQGFVAPGQTRPLFVVFGEKTCYILSFTEDHHPRVRSFVLSASVNKTAILAREIPLTIAAMNVGGAFTGVFIAGATEGIDVRDLSERIGIPTERIDTLKLTGTESHLVDDATPEAAFLAAYAAALPPTRTRRADFRPDSVPYQGRRRVLQQALRTVCLCTTVILLAVGLNIRIQISRHHRTVADLKSKLLVDYGPIMNTPELPIRESVTSKLTRTLTQLDKAAKGLGSGDDNSVVSRLTYLLEAINNAMQVSETQSANKIGLDLERIEVGPKAVSIKGTTTGRKATQAMVDAIKAGGKLFPTNSMLKEENNRDNFQIGFELRQIPKAKETKKS